MVKTETTLSKKEGIITIVDYERMDEYSADELAAVAASIALTIAHRINRAYRNNGSEIAILEIIQRISDNMKHMEEDYQQQRANGNKPMLTP